MMYLDSQKLLDALFKVRERISKIVKDPNALKILNLTDLKYETLQDNEIRNMLTYAYINKVLSLLLFQRTKYNFYRDLGTRIIQQRRNFLINLNQVLEAFDKCHTDCVIFKTLRPIPETPVDIDVLIESKYEAYKLISYLRKKFRIELYDENRYSIGIRISEFKEFIDFYISPHVADLVYLDPKPLLKNKIYLHINELGVDMFVPIPKPELEFCSVLAHSIIKEGLVTLNDVISLTTYELLSDSDEIAQWLCKFSLDITYSEFIKTLKMVFPNRINYRARSKVLASLLKDKYTVSSLPYFIFGLSKRLNRIIEQRKKITYVRGFGR